MEDLVEQLVGEIQDEYDEDAIEPQATGLTGTVEVDGLDTLDEFKNHTGLELPEGPYETVAGYVMATLGRLPVIGDTVTTPRMQLEVRELDGRRASRIRISPLSRPESMPE